MKLLDPEPPMPERMPRYGDEEPLGIQFFRVCAFIDELDYRLTAP